MKQSVKMGNPESNVAVCTLWTPIELIDKHLDKDDYAIIGQLYSKDAGLNTILRYCLGNKNIRYIIVCGLDRSQSGQAIICLKKNGVDESRNVIGVNGARVDNEIPLEAINRFRENVEIIDERNNSDYEKLGQMIKKLAKTQSYGDPESFPEAKVEIPLNFPTDPIFKIRSSTVGEAWLQALQLIMKFGTLKDSEHGEKQKEVLCLVVDITSEDPDNIKWKSYFTFPKEELEEYYQLVLSDQKIEELSYTYGQRLRAHRGIDQIRKIAEKITNADFTRRAIAFTWDTELDTDSKHPPCLNLVQALVQNNKLYMIAYLRSNDIFGAWPKNVFALRKLQKNICEETKKELGDIIMISASAHIYEGNFRQANEILREYPLEKNIGLDLPRSTGNLDPRGNIHIDVSESEIKLTHLNPEGARLEEFNAKNIQEASRWLILGQKISDISHAIYLGQELMKAEICIKKGLKYSQDMPLGL